MNFSNYRFTLDMQKSKAQASLPVHFGDTGNRFYITLTDGGNPYIIGDGCRVDICIKKPNGVPLINACIIENNAIVRYDFNKNTASVEGMHKCELRLYSPEGRLITTPYFIMVVDSNVVYDDEIGTEEDLQKLMAMDVIAKEEERRLAEFERWEGEEARKVAETERQAAVSQLISSANASIDETVARSNDAISDAILEWDQKVDDSLVASVEQTTASTEDNGENVITFTFGDGRISELKVRNGSRGATGRIGSIETIKGGILHFFVGTQEEYALLTEEQRQDCFCIITDVTDEEGIREALEHLKGLLDGTITVPKASHADTASRASSASQAYEDSYGVAFKEQYLNAPNSGSRGYVTGTLADGVTILASCEEYGTFYHARLIHSSLRYYDFGIIHINGNEDAIITSPMVTVTDTSREVRKYMLVITPDGWLDTYRTCKVEVWEFDLNGNRVTDSGVNTATIEMRGLNTEFIIGE